MDEGYGRFGSYSRVEMEQFFHLDDEDRRLVAMRRRDCNRLGFAVQMVTVRHLGMFLPDPLEIGCGVILHPVPGDDGGVPEGDQGVSDR